MKTGNQSTGAAPARSRKRNRAAFAGWLVITAASGALASEVSEHALTSAPLPLAAINATPARELSANLDADLDVNLDIDLDAAPQPIERPSADGEADIEAAPEAHDAKVRWFDGRPARPVRTVRMRVTAYSPDEQSCGEWADGVTASNKSVFTNGMKLVAADTSLFPMRTMLSIPGYDEGRIVPVLDRGGAIKGARLDVLYPTHETALEWGVQRLDVTVWEFIEQ